MTNTVSSDFKSGFLALTGRPNAGKSSLINSVVGEKVAITSNVSQTTRRRVRGILTTSHMQLVLVDTPGLHKPKDVLGEELNRVAMSSIEDVDAVAFLADLSKPIGRGDRWIADRLKVLDIPLICVLTKKDKVTEDIVAEQVEEAIRLADWDALICLSAKTGYNVGAFVDECERLLPEGPMWFPPDSTSDSDLELIIAELVREKALHDFHDEIPHSIGVSVDSIEDDGGIVRIEATVLTERESQKAMVIGKGGRAVKRIGSAARKELEDILGAKVHLALSVKARPGWRSDMAQLERFGYAGD